MNLVEFAIKFKDLASGQLKSFGTSANSTFSKIQSFSDQLTGKNKITAQSYSELERKIKQVESVIANSTLPSQIRAAKRELESLQSQASRHPGNTGIKTSGSGSGFGSGIGMQALGLNAALDLGSKAKDLAKEAWNSTIAPALERQKIKKSFEVMAGSEKAGGELTNQLVSLQKDTILGGEVFKNAQLMMGYGFKSNEIASNLKMLGDVSMGDAEKLGSLARGFSQTKAMGRLMGEDLEMYITGGFNPLAEISKRTGKSMAVLRNEMSKGLISFGMVQQAFKDTTSEGGMFNNMLNKMAELPAGKVAQMEGAWDEFKIKAGEVFMPIVTGLLDFGSKALPIFEKMLTPLSTGVGHFVKMVQYIKPLIVDAFSPAITFIKQLITNTEGWNSYIQTAKNLFTTGLIPALKDVFSVVVNIAGRIIEFVQKSELLKDIFKLSAWIWEQIYASISLIMKAIGWTFENVVMPIVEAIEWVYKLVKGLISGDNKFAIALETTNGKAKGGRKAFNENSGLITESAKLTNENNNLTQTADSEITKGGPKIININVQKFFDDIVFSNSNMKESASEIERIVLESLARVLGQGVATI